MQGQRDTSRETPPHICSLLWVLEGTPTMTFDRLFNVSDRDREGHKVILGKTGSGRHLSASEVATQRACVTTTE